MPESSLVASSAAMYEEETAKYAQITSGPDYAMVQRLGERIAVASGKNYDWQFRLLEAPQVANAFALPGGKVAIYSGLLPIAQGEDALAAVVGHEVAHVTAQHGNERVSTNMAAETGIALLGAAASNYEGMDAEDRALLIGALGMGTQYGVLMPFSRLHESEADEIGLRYLVRAGYDPNAAPEFWERMAAMSGGSRQPEWLSTHPDPLRRAEELRKLIPTIVREERGGR